MSARPKYFTQGEIALHNTSTDIWVSFLGKVYNLTPLCDRYRGDILLKPILQFAGKDISHWFNAKTNDVRRYVDPLTNCLLYYTPHGRFIHIPPPFPCSAWENDFGLPWWKDDSYCIGVLSKKTRNIKIVNTLTSQEQVIEVCAEETINEILQRFLVHNSHAASYTWKYNCQNLDMDKTLEENGIKDDNDDFYRLRMNEDDFLQCILLYFNDDLTEA